MKPPHPDQPLYLDGHGVVRFRKNAIVEFLLDAGPFDMNQLAVMPFEADDRTQFAQLIGYSQSGFGELSYVSDEAYDRSEMAREVLMGRAPADELAKDDPPPSRKRYHEMLDGAMNETPEGESFVGAFVNAII